VVWTVFAAPEFSVQPLRWCFLFAGCVSYKGYFSKEEADRFAAEVSAQGHDVYVGGVAAYSTLGVLADPVLNTFIHYPTSRWRDCFHELAHQAVREDIPRSTNHSRWRSSGKACGAGLRGQMRRADARRNQRIRAEFVELIGVTGTPEAPPHLPCAGRDGERKRAMLADLETEARTLQEGVGRVRRLRPLVRENAPSPDRPRSRFTLVLSRRSRGVAERKTAPLRFYAAVKELAALPKEERDKQLRALAPSMTSEW
jgi:predicted aminopeptidase